jgi:SNF2 family DNA or RNA helicase
MSDNFYDDPRVKELLSKIGELEARITSMVPKLDQINAHKNTVKSAKEEWLKGVNEELAKFDRQIREADQQALEIEHMMRDAKQLQAQIHSQVSQTVEELQVANRLDEAEAQWASLLDENDWLWKENIRPFQTVCTQFTVNGFVSDLAGVVIADQMGLGKTLEATASLDVIQTLDEYDDIIAERCPSIDITSTESLAVLWVCPNSIKETTVREIRKWSPDRKTIKLEGAPGVRNQIVKLAHANGMVLIVSYEQLRERKGNPTTPELLEHSWPIVVLDEAHKFKGDNTSTFTMVETICKDAGFVVPMTGTPIMNRPEELWAILHMTTLKGKYEGKFDQKWRFQNEFCWSAGSGSQFASGGYDRLIREISDMVIRRRKDEVLVDMPDKVREIRFVTLGEEQRNVYDQMRDTFLIWLDDQKSDFISATSILAQLTRLRQLALYPAGVKIIDVEGGEHFVSCEESAKLDEAMEILDELFDNDEKCLIFSNYNEPLKVLGRQIEEKYGVEVGYIIGGQNDIRRAETQERFNDPESKLKVVLGNIAAMGLGLNLQSACSNAIFLDLGWNPGVNEQAEDRLHRQGQKNAVTIHIIQAEDTVDGFIALKLEEKQNMIDGIIERKELRKMVEEGLI